MRTDRLVVFSIIFCILGICFTSFAGCAQSARTDVSLPAYIRDGPVPGGYTGYVLDEDGRPVPGATVSLGQEGQLWQPEKYNYPRLLYNVNPQTTRITYYDTDDFLKEGGFLFSLPLPGEYTLAAEKDGYKGSADVRIPRELLYPDRSDPVSRTFAVNITLKGYHRPAFSPEQLSYTGAIVGETRTPHGCVGGGNVSLWRDGRMVEMPDNPHSALHINYSSKTIDYKFEHVAPGNYTVRVEYWMGGDYNDTASVDVGARPVRADIVLSMALH